MIVSIIGDNFTMSTPLQIGPLISEIIEKIYDDRLTSSDLKSDEKNPTNTILT
jgi:hypothetical protein